MHDRTFNLVIVAGFRLVLSVLTALGTGMAAAQPDASWRSEWPRTDFSKHAVSFAEIESGGPPKDGIPAIDRPQFIAPAKAARWLDRREPVIVFEHRGDARAYPLQVLMFHEIVNDTVGGLPVAVTFCPLCNASIVFDRRVNGAVLDFGTTGKLRHSDLVMYDRQTESWWQQYSGTAIVGELTGSQLPMLPVRIEAFQRFRQRHPEGRVLVPNDPALRPYGANPYVGYDGARLPFLYDGSLPEGIAPMAYVVAVGDDAWALSLLREKGRIAAGDLELTWEPGQNSALDHRLIAEGRDVGNVVVQRRVDGRLTDVPHHVTFAFVFHAFQPEGNLHTR
jgi:hypothetical protein